MARDFQSKDEGKHVMTADGDVVGTIEQVSGTDAHVKPEADLSSSTRRRLGWSDEGKETYMLQKSKVDRITDEGVRLEKNM